MPTERDDCIDEIGKRLGRDRQDVEDVFNEVFERAKDEERATGKDSGDALNAVGQKMLDEMGEAASGYKRAEFKDRARRISRWRWYDRVMETDLQGAIGNGL